MVGCSFFDWCFMFSGKLKRGFSLVEVMMAAGILA
ncbi:MAG: prepilin-type N-terminal cleavage/methylation domain-containing protein, partial [Anaerohalosphaera sp.]|nr:prepilin-type N-terminal cleavage/methylation domain-containing protein [Anaerohalosphaera sp.]